MRFLSRWSQCRMKPCSSISAKVWPTLQSMGESQCRHFMPSGSNSWKYLCQQGRWSQEARVQACAGVEPRALHHASQGPALGTTSAEATKRSYWQAGHGLAQDQGLHGVQCQQVCNTSRSHQGTTYLHLLLGCRMQEMHSSGALIGFIISWNLTQCSQITGWVLLPVFVVHVAFCVMLTLTLCWLALHVLTSVTWLDAGAWQVHLASMSASVCCGDQNFTFDYHNI